jgi:eukaryotic-like serine/threonine-protein kinase
MDINQLGRYVVERVLGRGAMGVVYLAKDPVIGRDVALKTLTVSPDAEDAEEFRLRFVREAQAAGRLNHPGIVTVHDTGVDQATGLSFMAMEYIEGRSLKDLLRGGHAFAYSEVARIGAALAGALDYAHSKGVVHRDIKPANIIFTSQGLVKITDFGVARLEASNLTATGQFIGTPNYMAPEQVVGGVVDGRADLFSLGVVLFELLTGTRPFVGASLTEVTYKIVHEPSPIPSQLRQGLPPAFNPILLKLLEKDPEKRYPRGADVARALDALRRVLIGAAAESGQRAQALKEPATAPTSPVQPAGAVATHTRATEIDSPRPTPSPEPAPLPAPPQPAKPKKAAPVGGGSVWRLPIAEGWVAMMLACVVLPPGLLVVWLLTHIDRGPWPTVPLDEAPRRHRVSTLQREAAAALAAGNPTATLQALSTVFMDAPYSSVARGLKLRADALLSSQRDVASKETRASALRDEGRELYRQGRWRESQQRFEEALVLAPGDATARDFLVLAREHQAVRREAVAPVPVQATLATPTPAPPMGDGSLELYFNCPLSLGSVELELDGKPLKTMPFNFYSKGLLWLKKKGQGLVQATMPVAAGEHTVDVQLKGEQGRSLGGQSLPVHVTPGARVVLKIEMAGETAIPSFAVTYPSKPLK